MAAREGDLQIIKQAVEAGVDINGRDEQQNTPLICAVDTLTPNSEIVRYLIENGADLEARNEWQDTALVAAARSGGTAAVALLLEAGAQTEYSYVENRKYLRQYIDEEYADTFESENDREQTRHAISEAENTEIIRLLSDAGANLAYLPWYDFLELMKLPFRHKLRSSKDEFEPFALPRFGSSNPELMDNPHWQEMVLCHQEAYMVRRRYRWGFGKDERPLWCFDRFGYSITRLPNGRCVAIGGSHEDWYDADFCIYNDVVVFHGDGTFTILGYPRDVFPPTDFHTAVLVDQYIYIIGNLGYHHERQPGTTPVYRWHCDAWTIEKVETSGKQPGWLYEMKVERPDWHTLRILDGKIILADDEEIPDERTQYVFDFRTHQWTEIRPQ